MSATHALVPLAAALAVAKPPIRWTLLIVAAAAAAAPDVDTVADRVFGLPLSSIYGHRGFTHSVFVAVAVGCLAAIFHRRLHVRPLTAGIVVGASMASHGILDMMTDRGLPVAYLWPLSSVRLFADWRPIHNAPVQLAHIGTELLPRLRSELMQLIVPMLVIAFGIRFGRMLVPKLP